ncbi:hypothetical protein CMQ_891 [Grosmannia clavigera kw1407]|uniref:Vacuolar sorting protein Vps3844 C-terminal domain-containing protein n=1 Tax=Grosmannia clavigera (strain kw1407 / UAMH 11150) TaxID=655863 RepID=F0XCV1_GROCL|nr:uncharacterized protein CMQ_891 [Grosmannia clavigera kw1407]EFX03963.1 hypothetical protein CMQ_891 [Grosmannia clavigera kw1407]
MKFLAGLAVAASLVSSALAVDSKDAAPVYILRKQNAAATANSPAEPPQVPRQIFRQVLLQRLQLEEGSGFLNELPTGYDAEATLDLISQYGLPTPPLFSEHKVSPPQVVILFERVKAQHVTRLQAALPAAYRQPSFVIADPPSQKANEHLINELKQAGMRVKLSNVMSEISSLPGRYKLSERAHVGLYDLSDADEILILEQSMNQLISDVESGAVEVTLVLLPESSRKSKLKHWTNTAPRTKLALSDELRELREKQVREAIKFRASAIEEREAQSESVMIEEDSTDSSSNKKDDGRQFLHEWAATTPTAIPACFQSFNSCVTQTGNCSSHGVCVDKYAYNSGGVAKADGAASCFVCHCYSTLNRPETEAGGLSTTQWAGNMCHKKDISAPFWLLTGFSVTMVGVVTFSIAMLFNVGEEKLPGVIGAGVSVGRSK